MKKLLSFVLKEPVLLTVVMVSAGAIWAFVELAEGVSEGDSRMVDEWTLLVMRNPEDRADPIGPRWFEEMMRDYTALGGYGVLTALTIAVALYLWLRQQHRMALLVLTAVIGGIILSTTLKSIFDRPRPDLVPHGSIVYSKSFPSGHAMMSAATYLTLGAMMAQAEKRRQLRIFFLSLGLMLTFVVGTSRVYLGVHWPTDVLAGWTAGGAWALICWSVAQVIERRAHKLQLPTAPQ